VVVIVIFILTTLHRLIRSLQGHQKKLPTLSIKRKPKSIFDYTYDDFELIDYVHDDPIKAPVAV